MTDIRTTFYNALDYYEIDMFDVEYVMFCGSDQKYYFCSPREFVENLGNCSMYKLLPKVRIQCVGDGWIFIFDIKKNIWVKQECQVNKPDKHKIPQPSELVSPLILSWDE